MSTPEERPSDRPTPGERIWHFLTLIAVGSLFGVYGLGLLAGERSTGDWLVFGILVLPLLAFVPSLLTGSARAAAMLSFVSILYFGAGVLTIVDPTRRAEGSAELFYATLLFVASAYYARQRGVRDAALTEPPPQA